MNDKWTMRKFELGWVVFNSKGQAITQYLTEHFAQHVLNCVNLHDELVGALDNLVDNISLSSLSVSPISKADDAFDEAVTLLAKVKPKD